MGDYIEREALLSLVQPDDPNDEKSAITVATAKNLIRSLARRVPAANVATVRHGSWVQSGQCNHKPYRLRNTDKWTTYKCSECGSSNGRRFNDKYCPNCGAKMDKEDRDDG